MHPRGGPGDDRLLGIVEDLGPEAAAHIGGDDAQLVFGDLQHEGAHQQADHVRVLAGGIKRVFVRRRVKIADRGARLHGVRDQPVVHQLELHHLVRADEGRGVHRRVADMPIVADIAGDAVMHLGRALGDRRLGRGDGGQHGVVHVDRLSRVARLGLALGDHHGDRIADEADLALGEDGVRRLLHRGAVLGMDLPAAGQAADTGHIRTGEDRDNARHGGSSGGVDPGDRRMGVRAAEDHGVGLVGAVDIVGVMAATGEEPQILLALHAGTDALERNDVHSTDLPRLRLAGERLPMRLARRAPRDVEAERAFW